MATGSVRLAVRRGALIGARGDERFVAAPLVLTGTFCALWMVVLAARTPGVRVALRHERPGRAGIIASTAVRIVLGGILTWLAVRGGANVRTHRRMLSFEATFCPYIRTASTLRRAACGDPTVALGVYPEQSLLYYFTGLRPVAGYLFMPPWVAEIALPAVIDDLGRRDTVVAVDVAGNVWGHENRVYLAPLLRYLDGNYRQLGTNLWVSPAFAARCHEMGGGGRP
jgi:hypothetical protein